MHSLRHIFPAAVFFCCLASMINPADAAAESVKAQQWEINADKLTRLENPVRIAAEGHVELIKMEKTTGPKAAAGSGAKDSWKDLLGDAGSAAEETDVGAASENALPATDGDTVTHSKTVPMIRGNSSAAPETVTMSKVMTTIKADRMLYNLDTGTVEMNGKVFIDIGQDHLAADGGTVNLKQETGFFENAAIIRQEKDLHFEGRKIEKTGDLTYRIEDGWIITCKLKDGETPPWSFKAAEADITDNGYAYLKHATFRIKDVPVLYTPIMVLPAKRNRQTGFLFPLVSMSDRNGFGMELPFFWDISPSSDITLYPHYIANRGVMAGAEGRYALDQRDKGTFMANFLADDLEAEGRYTYTDQNRYWVRGKADQQFGDWTTRLDVDLLSDSDYLLEFDSGRTGLTMSDRYYLEQFGRGLQDKTVNQRSNSFRTLRSWGNGMSLQASVMGIDDLQEEESSSSTALWKLPEVKHNGRLPLYDEVKTDLSWNTDYVHYWREEGVGAQRIDLYPKVTTAVPLWGQRLNASVSVGARDTMYSINGNGDETWENSDTENRLLGSVESEISTLMRKDFGESSDGWSHAARPFLKHAYVSEENQEVPLFDEVDSFGDQNRITYGINNFFTISRLAGRQEIERDYGYIKLQQSYDLRSEAEEEPFLPVELRTAWYPTQHMTFKYETDLNVYDDGFIRHFAESDYRSVRGDIFSLDYLFAKNTSEGDDTNSIRLSTLIKLMYDFSAGYSLEKSLENSVTVQEKVRLIYHPACWAVELAAETTPDNEQITLMFQLANIGSPFGIDF